MIQSYILKNIINKLRCNPKKNVQITQKNIRKDNRELQHRTRQKGTTDKLEADAEMPNLMLKHRKHAVNLFLHKVPFHLIQGKLCFS